MHTVTEALFTVLKGQKQLRYGGWACQNGEAKTPQNPSQHLIQCPIHYWQSQRVT